IIVPQVLLICKGSKSNAEISFSTGGDAIPYHGYRIAKSMMPPPSYRLLAGYFITQNSVVDTCPHKSCGFTGYHHAIPGFISFVYFFKFHLKSWPLIFFNPEAKGASLIIIPILHHLIPEMGILFRISFGIDLKFS